MRWFFGLPLAMFAAAVFVVGSPAAAEVVQVDLGMSAPSGGNNSVSLQVDISVSGINKSDSDTATVSGNMLTKLQAEFDPTTQALISLTGIDFYGGNFAFTPIALDYDFGWLIGELHGTGSGIGGTFDTIPSPFAAVTGNNTFNAADHEAIVDQGQLQVSGSGLLLSGINESFNMATDPVSGTTEGSGTVSVSLASVVGNTATYNVNLVLPLAIDQDIDTSEFPVSADVNVAAAGTIAAAGQFTRTISVNPIAVDDPMSGNESYYNVLEDNQLTIAAGQGVLVNDSDPNNDTLSAIKVSDPAHGSVTLNSNGSLVYTPDANWHGTDSFTYKANDGANDSNVATVDVVVDSVLDVPDVTLGLIDNGAVGSGLHSYTLTATGIGITSLSEFTIDGEVHQVFNGGEQTEWLGDGSAIDTEVTDSYVIFGDERIPDQGLTPVVITEETIDVFDDGSTDSGMGTLNNSEDSLASHDIYLKTGTPSTDVDTVELMQLVLEEGAGFDATVKLLASMAFGVTGPGESDISIHNLVYSLAASFLDGDANNDGVVDLIDLGRVADNWGTGSTWAEGDFNDDGTVDLIDLGRVADNWGATSTAAVPEPSTIVMLILGALCLVGYRTRK